ncbi:MAG: hypothetical protein EDM05_032435 [Leptolyngbya sp. IPPAS B-1204]|uniref:Uncharacterized protein n=1 Tax=Leptolyngbya sp. NK1-12 TaxID=2547451 RepID=A0AA96WWJ5_9CYAN|nr:hypothetical protein [Leptolyngbya sp. NK1-12]MBF2047661.1 hypothetical protein [Elainella sp. C42_A2020_010]RNJ70606.1 MAG: hypothetical protein EDM05_03980 [Leptolyngbya sp. IPPAS B-1204]WNZ25242.1 hypothetical protein HJG54_21880 [Leptolyngbya sp. NK1-12]
MNQKVELKTFTQEEVLLAAETLNTAGIGKRRIMLTSESFSALEDQIRQLPNTPGLPPGEIVPGVGGYLYNIPVFVDPNNDGNYMI